MAKKSKHYNRRDVNTVVEKSAPETMVGNRPIGFNPDYHNVRRDIRRVGILAGSFIIILVALSFFLH
jgi:hypothetical protein